MADLILLLFLATTFGELYISNEKRTWFEAVDDVKCLLAAQKGEVIEPKLLNLSDGVNNVLWVGGYVESSWWVSYTGCVLATPLGNANSFNVTSDVYSACMQKCDGQVAVHSNECYCGSKVDLVDISCDSMACPLLSANDKLGFCGTGYLKEPEPHGLLYKCMCTYEKTPGLEFDLLGPEIPGDCMSVTFTFSEPGLFKTTLHPESCSATLDGVICTNLSSFYVQIAQVTWEDALRYCAKYGMRAAIESVLHLKSLVQQTGSYWLGIRRITYSGWGTISQRSGSYERKCRALNVSEDGHWSEVFISCSLQLPVLCNASGMIKDNETTPMNPQRITSESSGTSPAVTAVIVIFLLLLAVFIFILILFYLRRKGKWRKSPLELFHRGLENKNNKKSKPTFVNNFYDSIFKKRSVIRSQGKPETQKPEQNVYDHLHDGMAVNPEVGHNYDTMEDITGYAHLEAGPQQTSGQGMNTYDTMDSVNKDGTLYANIKSTGTGHYDTVETFRK